MHGKVGGTASILPYTLHCIIFDVPRHSEFKLTFLGILPSIGFSKLSLLACGDSSWEMNAGSGPRETYTTDHQHTSAYDMPSFLDTQSRHSHTVLAFLMEWEDQPVRRPAQVSPSNVLGKVRFSSLRQWSMKMGFPELFSHRFAFRDSENVAKFFLSIFNSLSSPILRFSNQPPTTFLGSFI
ncbi:hypothetical protein VNO77_08028 [Canavalia gladiata]|uniref:Uncharacterized protein n=1 Tax=Canavalia gladiata TaxID=3824 RepID=A0AAN9QWF2_CANGL